MIWFLILFKIRPTVVMVRGMYRLGRNSIAVRGRWCHTSALLSGSSVELFVYTLRFCHQTVTFSVWVLGEFTSHNYKHCNLLCILGLSEFLVKFWLGIVIGTRPPSFWSASILKSSLIQSIVKSGLWLLSNSECPLSLARHGHSPSAGFGVDKVTCCPLPAYSLCKLGSGALHWAQSLAGP